MHPKSRDFELEGSWLRTGDSNTYDVWLTSCASQFTLFDGSEVGGDENCVWDLKEVQKYLGGGFYMSVYHNQQEFI